MTKPRTVKSTINTLVEEITFKDIAILAEWETSQDALENLLGDYMVVTQAESYFKKRKDKIKATLLENPTIAAEVDEAILTTVERDAGFTKDVASTEIFSLTIGTRKGSRSFNATKLRNKLMLIMTPDEVEALFEDCADVRSPSVTYKVEEN